MGVQNYTMAFRIFISLVLASTVTSIELGCGDYSYNICHDPPANQELHVGSLEECIQNCDLFATFDQCDYLLYWETGPDENCKINISTPAELLGSPSLTTGQRGAPVLKGQITNVLPPVTEPAKIVQQRVVMVTEAQSVRWKITQEKP